MIGGRGFAATPGHVASSGMPNMDGEGDRSDDAGLRCDRSVAAVVRAKKPLHLPAFFLAKGSAFASGEVPEGLLAEEFFAKAMVQARQESALPFELRAGLELVHIWIGRGEVQRAHDLIGPGAAKSRVSFTAW